jgi:outer membrane protein TolC
MKKKLSIIIFSLLCHLVGFTQDSIYLTLDHALRLAGEQSLQTFLNKHYYMADYWAYRSYKADYLPSLNLRATLPNYSNATQLRFNSASMTDEFIRTQTLQADINLNVTQKVALTGGTFFVQSELNRIENFGSNKFTQYSSRPFRIGYSQELFGFNNMKWQKRIEPVKFKKARLEYVQNTENMYLTTVNLYFGLLRAYIQMEIAQNNITNTENLLQLANRRFELGLITREELLDLRLSQNNAVINLQQAGLNHRDAKENLLNFLMLPLDVDIAVEIPENIPVEEVDVQLVLQKALDNNPEILQFEQNMLEGQRNVEQANKSRHFRADVNLSYGVSGQDSHIVNVYSPDFENHQQAIVGINIPILDWGRNKGQYELAKSQYQLTQTSIQQSLQKFNQNALSQAIIFNIQKSRLESAAISDTLANESYELTMTRFRNGQVDVLRLTTSQSAKDYARLQYINALSEYWSNYYSIRKLTLYDFEKNEDIKFNEDELLKQ